MLRCKDTRIKTQQRVFIHTMYQTGFFYLTLTCKDIIINMILANTLHYNLLVCNEVYSIN